MKKKQPRRSRSSRCVIQFSMRYEAEYAYCWRECGAIPIGWGADMAREFYDILVYPDVKEADSTRRWRASPKSYTCEFRIWHPSTLTLKPVPAGIEILLYRTFSMDKLLDHVAEDQALSLTVEETLVLLRKTLRAARTRTEPPPPRSWRRASSARGGRTRRTPTRSERAAAAAAAARAKEATTRRGNSSAKRARRDPSATRAKRRTR